ncbi:MAG: ADP-ribosylation factor-like protein [Promethearchaeota archaeon]
MEFLTKEPIEMHKILFTGLDTAGKSSIIYSLKREFSQIINIEPTKGISRRVFQFFDKDISEWDLGGQEKYRISYIKNPSLYFDGTEVAIYVIDILNNSRIPESLSYFRDVVYQFERLKIKPPINILFHKCDPELIKNTPTKIERLIANLTEQLLDIAKSNKLYFFRTSIYDLYSIMSAVSEILLQIYPKAQLIQKAIEEFGKKLNCDGLMIVDDNSIIVGSYFSNSSSKALLQESIQYFLTLNDCFLNLGEIDDDDQILVQKLGHYFLFKTIILKEFGCAYHLSILKAQNPYDLYFIKRELQFFIERLLDIINK